jgi:hypothetical protein
LFQAFQYLTCERYDVLPVTKFFYFPSNTDIDIGYARRLHLLPSQKGESYARFA